MRYFSLLALLISTQALALNVRDVLRDYRNGIATADVSDLVQVAELVMNEDFAELNIEFEEKDLSALHDDCRESRRDSNTVICFAKPDYTYRVYSRASK